MLESRRFHYFAPILSILCSPPCGVEPEILLNSAGPLSATDGSPPVAYMLH